MRQIYAIPFLLVSAVVLSACTHNPEQTEVPTVEITVPENVQNSQTEESGLTEDMTAEEMPVQAEAAEYVIDAFNYGYSQTTIRAQAGETVKIRLTASEGMHDFVIDELEVQSELVESGEETEFEFTVPEDAAGKEFEFYCSIGNHRAMGMVGSLMVE